MTEWPPPDAGAKDYFCPKCQRLVVPLRGSCRTCGEQVVK